MQFNSIDIYTYILGDLKLVEGLWVHTCTPHVDVFSDFDQNEAHIFLYVTTNVCYSSAKPYMIYQRGHLIDNTNLSRVKYGPLTLCLR